MASSFIISPKILSVSFLLFITSTTEKGNYYRDLRLIAPVRAPPARARALRQLIKNLLPEAGPAASFPGAIEPQLLTQNPWWAKPTDWLRL